MRGLVIGLETILQRDFISEILNRQKSNHQNGAVAGELQWCYVIGYCIYVNIVNMFAFCFFVSSY